jgi:hypothetical protein
MLEKKSDDYGFFFLNLLQHVNTHHHWICHAYCLLDNHYHLLIGALVTRKGGKGRDVHKIINFHFYDDLFPCWDGRISIPLSSSCSGEVGESLLYINSF